MEKLFYAGVLAGLIAITYGMTYKFGELHGSTEVYKAWAEEKDRRDKAYAALEKKNAAMSAAHQKREQELGDNLREVHDQYEAALASARTEFADRLLGSETRAGIYQRQARGSALEQERLARHAAELDRSLEEGRALVREFRATLEQRDRTIHALGQIILNDRTLFTGEPNGY